MRRAYSRCSCFSFFSSIEEKTPAKRSLGRESSFDLGRGTLVNNANQALVLLVHNKLESGSKESSSRTSSIVHTR